MIPLSPIMRMETFRYRIFMVRVFDYYNS